MILSSEGISYIKVRKEGVHDRFGAFATVPFAAARWRRPRLRKPQSPYGSCAAAALYPWTARSWFVRAVVRAVWA
jgi:hypothetical protein